MIKRLLCTGVLLFGVTTLRADVFSFNYAGKGVDAAGTLTASGLGKGYYLITDISGYRNKQAISDTPIGAGVFYYSDSAKTPLLDALGIAFSVSGLGLDTISYINGIYREQIIGLKPPTTLTKFSISRVPEPSALLLLFATGLGFWIMARKLAFKKTPSL